MPRMVESEVFLPLEITEVREAMFAEQEPSAEKLGTLTNLNRTKKANMDAHQYTLRG